MTVAEAVLGLIAEKIGYPPKAITPEASFQRDLGMDSLEYTDLLLAAEERFIIEIDDEVAEGIKTVGDLVAYVKALIAKEAPPVAGVAPTAVWEQMGCVFWGGRCR